MENNTQENSTITYPIQDGYETPICFKFSADISETIVRHSYGGSTMTREDCERMDDDDWYDELELREGYNNWDFSDVDYQSVEVQEKSISESHDLFGPDDLNEDGSSDLLWTIQVGLYEGERIPFAEYLERMGLSSIEAFKELMPHEPEKVERYEAAWKAQAPKGKVIATALVDRDIAEIPDELRLYLRTHLKSFATILMPHLDFDSDEINKKADSVLPFIVASCRVFLDDGAYVDTTPKNVPLHIVETDTDGVENGVE